MSSNTPHNLLPVSRAFTGRDAELQALVERLQGQRVTWLTGPAGVGKTELARAAGHRVREGGLFPGGVFHLSLEAAGGVATLTGDLVFTLRIDETKPPKVAFEGPRRLVIWDQMDDVMACRPERVREVIGEHLADAEGLHHLVICREGAPDPEALALAGLAPEAAFQAFVNHLPDSVSARPEPGDPALAAALAPLEGNPLAIRLASRWCRPPRGANVLADGLAATARTETEFQGAAGRGLGLALDGLEEPDTRLLGLLGALPAGADGETLYAIHGEEWEAPAIRLEVHGLTETVGGRHLLHPAARSVLPTFLGPQRTETLWDQAAFHVHNSLAECRNQLEGGSTESPMRYMTREWENLRASFARAVQHLEQGTGIDEDEDARLVVDGALTVFHLFFARRMLSEGLAWTTAAIEAAERVDLTHELTTLTDYAGLFQVRLGDTEAAARSFADAVEAYRDMGQETGVGSASYHLGLLRYQGGDMGGARECFQTAYELLRASQNRAFAAQSATYLAQIDLAEGDAEAAYETLNEAVELYQEGTVDIELRIAAHFTLARAAALADHPEESLDHARIGAQAAFVIHPRAAGAAIPQILRLTDAYVRAQPKLVGPFAGDVAALVDRLKAARPDPKLMRAWQVSAQLLGKVAPLLTAVGEVVAGAEGSELVRSQSREDLREAARALDGVSAGMFGVEAWVASAFPA
jgi:tetratricopeptide (TPR) repeat protein